MAKVLSLAMCCSVIHAASEATYAGDTLHIPHAVYKGSVFDLEMTYQAPNKLLFKKAELVAGEHPDNEAVNISDDLNFSLSEI